MIDWRNGMLRLYFVLWGVWAVAIGTRTVYGFSAGEIDMPWAVFVTLALVLPGALFFAFRWALDGFFGASTSG